MEQFKESTSNYKKTCNYLHHKLGYSFETTKAIIRRFAVNHGIKFPTDASSPSYYREMYEAFDKAGNSIQSQWDNFMKFYGTIKRDYIHELYQQKKEGIIIREIPELVKK